MITFLIALLDRSLNVTTSVQVEHDFDGELPDAIIINRDSDQFDIVFPPFIGPVFVEIVFNRTIISTEPIELIAQRN